MNNFRVNIISPCVYMYVCRDCGRKFLSGKSPQKTIRFSKSKISGHIIKGHKINKKCPYCKNKNVNIVNLEID